MSSSHLNNRAESHFQAREEHELETLGNKAWDNPVYNGSPSSSLKIRAIYNPKSILENPYENIEKLTDSLPYQKEREKDEMRVGSKKPFSACCFYICKGIRGNWVVGGSDGEAWFLDSGEGQRFTATPPPCRREARTVTFVQRLLWKWLAAKQLRLALLRTASAVLFD